MLTNILLSEVIKEKYDTLSEGQKNVAKFLLEQPEESAFKTATQIGKQVGVSESTVIRLSFSLGLDGFTHLQHHIREQFLKTNSTVYKFQESTKSIVEENNIFASVLARDIEILNDMLNNLSEDALWKIVNAIIESDQVIVVGHRISEGPAYWFSFILNLMLGKVNMYPGTKDMVENMMTITSNSVVILISFSRYRKESIRFSEIAKEKGAQVIAITDKLLSPSARIAHKIITTEVNSSSGMDSITSITSLLNLIIAGVSHKNHSKVKERLKVLEKEYQRQGIFADN